MIDPVLLSRRNGPVLVLTLNRPDKLNAIDSRLVRALIEALDRCEADDDVRAIVITGAGRAFSAGADIAEFRHALAAGPAAAIRDFVRPGQELSRRIESFPKPVIAAVNGLAFGGGCEIVEAMHLAIASEGASFAKAEIDIGIIPVFGGTQRLPRHVGAKRATEMILTGKPIDASTALELRLVNQVVPAGEEVKAAIKLGTVIASKARPAVRAALLAIQRGLNASIDEGLLIEAAAFEQMASSQEALDGIDRFLESRGKSKPARNA